MQLTGVATARGLPLALLRAAAPRVAAVGVPVVSALVCANAIVRDPRPLRFLVALIAFTILGLAALRSPRNAAVATLLVLPFLALSRRLLLPFAPWSTKDPLLFVGAATAAWILLQTGRRLDRDPLARLVLAYCVLAAIEVLNPIAGPPSAGVLGLGVLLAPLLWFFVGRAVADAAAVRRVVQGILAIAVVVALYGLIQTERGFPFWDAQWIQNNGYAALHVGNAIRAFGTFSSSAEYALFLAVATTMGLGLLLHGRLLPVAVLPLIAVALFLDADRGAIVLGIVATLVLLSLRTGRPLVAAVTAVGGLLAVWYAQQRFGSGLVAQGASSGNALVAHQLSGLGNPGGSTLHAHLTLTMRGVESGFTRPWGVGTANVGGIGSRFGGSSAGTETDFADAFANFGLVGGFVFVGIIALTVKRVVRLYFRRREPLVFVCGAVLFTTFGSWLNTGYYALAPLVWFLIGWLTQQDAGEPEHA